MAGYILLVDTVLDGMLSAASNIFLWTLPMFGKRFYKANATFDLNDSIARIFEGSRPRLEDINFSHTHTYIFLYL